MAGLTIKVLLYIQKHIFLHCNASNLVRKISQDDKIWGTIPRLQILGEDFNCPPSLPVIYDHACPAFSAPQ